MKKYITSELRQSFQEKAFIQLGRNCQHFYQVKNITILLLGKENYTKYFN